MFSRMAAVVQARAGVQAQPSRCPFFSGHVVPPARQLFTEAAVQDEDEELYDAQELAMMGATGATFGAGRGSAVTELLFELDDWVKFRVSVGPTWCYRCRCSVVLVSNFLAIVPVRAFLSVSWIWLFVVVYNHICVVMPLPPPWTPHTSVPSAPGRSRSPAPCPPGPSPHGLRAAHAGQRPSHRQSRRRRHRRGKRTPARAVRSGRR